MDMEDLVRRCKNNDRDAFNELLSHYEHSMYRLCYSFTFNKEETLEILQEVYLRIFRSIHLFEENRPIFPWIKKIAINTSLNYRRNQKKHHVLSLDHLSGQDDSPNFHKFLASNQDVEEDIVYRDSYERIIRAIEQLPPQYRISIILRCIEEMTYDEIASALDQPLGTVKNNIFRARKLLKKSLEMEVSEK